MKLSGLKNSGLTTSKSKTHEKKFSKPKTIESKDTGRKHNEIPIYHNLENYFAIIAIVPGFLAVMAYEFLTFVLSLFNPATPYEPVNGLGILIPMALLTETFTFFLTRSLRKKINRLTSAIDKIAHGDFSVALDERKAAPFQDVYRNFNRMAEDLQSVETLRTDFINDFSHEFKTPISSIGGFARLLLDTEVSEEDRNEYLQIIADESERLTPLAEQTMTMSRLDSQNEIKNMEPFSLDEQIRKDIILLQKDWGKKQIQMDVELEPLPYYGNASMMEHVWINLLNNAVKFTPENGAIRVRGSYDPEPTVMQEQSSRHKPSSNKTGSRKIRITISDSGSGMTREQ